MTQKYNLYPIKTIKDWQGEDWDVYEEQPISMDIMIYRGRLYSYTQGRMSTILTPELAEFIKQHRLLDVAIWLGLSYSMIGRMKRAMEIQRPQSVRDDAWLLAHKEEILYGNFKVLEAKYGLSQIRVDKLRKWLMELIDPTEVKRWHRKRDYHVDQEVWFEQHQAELLNLTVDEIQLGYNVSKNTAKKFYDWARQVCQEKTLREQYEDKKSKKAQWLLQHEQLLLYSGLSAKALAQQLNKTETQITKFRTQLRKERGLGPSVVHIQAEAWLLDHQHELLSSEYSLAQLASRLNLSVAQVRKRKMQLKKLLGLASYFQEKQQWRLAHRDILLSDQYSVAEIAAQLDRPISTILAIRAKLRKELKENEVIAKTQD